MVYIADVGECAGYSGQSPYNLQLPYAPPIRRTGHFFTLIISIF